PRSAMKLRRLMQKARRGQSLPKGSIMRHSKIGHSASPCAAWSGAFSDQVTAGTHRYDGHCRAVRIGLFGSRYSEISTVPTLLNRLAAMSYGTTWLSGGNGRLVSAQRTETPNVQE